MASVELCQCCLRENEEEVADLWCNECSEAVCRNCGKAHRRFAVAHDVISIENASACRKAIPKYCLSHDNKLFILFCVGHDQLICHECLSESHRTCDKILEIEKAADGVKDSAALNDMKERMIKLASILKNTQTENEQQLSKFKTEKEVSNDHLKKIRKCFEDHLVQIEHNINTNYENIVKQNKNNEGQLSYLKQTVEENVDWLCMLESYSSESNIFCAVKHIDSMHVSSEKQVNEIKKDFATLSVHTLHPEVIKYIDIFFQELNDKSKFKTEPVITGSTNDCKKIPNQSRKSASESTSSISRANGG